MADTRSAAGEGSEPRVPDRDQPAQELANLIAQSDAKGKGFWRRRRRKPAGTPEAPPAGTTPAAAEPKPTEPAAEANAESTATATQAPEAQTTESQSSEARSTDVQASDAQASDAAASDAPASETGAAAAPDVKAGSEKPADDSAKQSAAPPAAEDTAGGAADASAGEAQDAESSAADVPDGKDAATAEQPAGDESPAEEAPAAEATAEGSAAGEPVAEKAAAESAEAEASRPAVGVVYEPDESPDGFPLEFGNIIVGLPKQSGAVGAAEQAQAVADPSAQSGPANEPAEAAQEASEATPEASDKPTPADAAESTPTGDKAHPAPSDDETAPAEPAATAASTEADSTDEQPEASGESDAISEQSEDSAQSDAAAEAEAGLESTDEQSADDQPAATDAEAASGEADETPEQSEASEQSGTAERSDAAPADNGAASSEPEAATEQPEGTDQAQAAEQAEATSEGSEATDEQPGGASGADGAESDGDEPTDVEAEGSAEQPDVESDPAEQPNEGSESEDAGAEDEQTVGVEAEGSAEEPADAADQSAEPGEGSASEDAESDGEQSASAEAEESAEQLDGAVDQPGAESAADGAGSDGESADAEASGGQAAAGDEQAGAEGEGSAEQSGADADEAGAAAASGGAEAGGEQSAGAEGDEAQSAEDPDESVEEPEELTAAQMAERVAAEQAAMALITALMRLRGALATSQLPIDVVGADEARQQQKAMLDQLDDYILPRLVQLEAPVLAVVGGSTGAGKSTLVNTIIGKVVSEPGVLRPTTRSPVLIHHPADAEWFAGDRVLPGMARSSGDRPGGTEDPGQLRLVAADTVPQGLAILDAPDIDSVVEANRDLATQLLAAADLWLFVTTAARYADAVPWDFLQSASDRSTAVAVVLDRAPEDTIDDITGHLAQMLLERGLGDSPLFSIRETVVDGNGMLPSDTVASIKDWLIDLAADAEARAAVVRRTLHGAVTAMVKKTPPFAAAVKAQAETLIELRSTAETAYDRAVKDIAKATQDGTLLRGEVLARWQEFVGTGELLKGLQTNVGRLRDKMKASVVGKPPPTRDLNDAVESGLESLLREHAEAAAERAEESWQSTAPGRQLLAVGDRDLGRMSKDFPAAAGRAVRDWQGYVLDLVRKEGADKRSTARILAYGVNGLGLSLMVVIFASTAGITGAEVGVGAGTAVVGQKLLEAVFGDQAVRTLVTKAREDLDGRVHALMDAEFARYLAVLDQHPVDPEAARQLTEAARAVEDCT
ncbi:AAA family ATPase [Kribbella sp. NPDC049174]|uniref:AAA family ATPase n=1 Tax=Kribbella sp. NPDC049174 TaxID=3364112 RepID=UPI003711DAE9